MSGGQRGPWEKARWWGPVFTVDQLPWGNLTGQPVHCFLCVGLEALVQMHSGAATLLPVAIILGLKVPAAACYRVRWLAVH